MDLIWSLLVMNFRFRFISIVARGLKVTQKLKCVATWPVYSELLLALLLSLRTNDEVDTSLYNYGHTLLHYLTSQVHYRTHRQKDMPLIKA